MVELGLEVVVEITAAIITISTVSLTKTVKYYQLQLYHSMITVLNHILYKSYSPSSRTITLKGYKVLIPFKREATLPLDM